MLLFLPTRPCSTSISSLPASGYRICGLGPASVCRWGVQKRTTLNVNRGFRWLSTGYTQIGAAGMKTAFKNLRSHLHVPSPLILKSLRPAPHESFAIYQGTLSYPKLNLELPKIGDPYIVP